ncbi:MAG: asparaginase, partial [Candidatus Dormibacteria bacterium]
AALWVAVHRDRGTAVAVKLEGGAGEAIPAVAIAVLRRLGALPDPLPEPLQSHAEPVLRNWAGTAVGRIEAHIGEL